LELRFERRGCEDVVLGRSLREALKVAEVVVERGCCWDGGAGRRLGGEEDVTWGLKVTLRGGRGAVGMGEEVRSGVVSVAAEAIAVGISYQMEVDFIDSLSVEYLSRIVCGGVEELLVLCAR